MGIGAHPPAARVVSLDLPERSVSGWPFVGRRTRGFGHGFLKAEVSLQTACPWGPRGDREEVRFRKRPVRMQLHTWPLSPSGSLPPYAVLSCGVFSGH